MILGVTDKRPRKVVGTQAFLEPGRTLSELNSRLNMRIEIEEINHVNGRVLVFNIPSRPLGAAIEANGRYLMRSGDSLVPMTKSQLQKIFNEIEPDYSSEACRGAKWDDLDPSALEQFKQMWIRKSGNRALEHMRPQQLMETAELATENRITYAALILTGKQEALGHLLPQAEVIFEYRSKESAGPAQQRISYRQGFLLFHNDLWDKINLRNDKQHYQDGMFMVDIPTFNEKVAREAVLNAVGHRNYRLQGSIFVRQYSRRLEVVSPGGFPPGITKENILYSHSARNRRLMEALEKCGLVERASQGVDRMFEECIKEAKPTPDYGMTDEYQVFLTLHGQVQNEKFLRFLERIGLETVSDFSTRHFLILDLISRDRKVPEELKEHLEPLLEKGIIEKMGYGKGTRHFLGRKFYGLIGKKGVYTRKRGLDKDTNKALLLKHIMESGEDGCAFGELSQVLPTHSRSQIHKLLSEMKKEKKINMRGRTKSGVWYPLLGS